MKKLLAILLTLIFAFSCFSVLGTTAMAEEEGNILVEKGFEGWTTTVSEANGDLDLVALKTEGEDEYYALKVGPSKTTGGDSRRTYIKSPTVQLVPGRDYELSLYLRAPDCASWSNAIAAPLVGVFMPITAYPTNNSYYAYNSGGISRRNGFVGTWQVEGYDEYQLQNFSFATHSGEGASFKKVMGGVQFQDAGFKDGWKKVTLKFTAMASSTNTGPEDVKIAIGWGFSGSSLDDAEIEVKDVEFKEFGAPATIEQTTLFSSELGKDGNMVAFDGSVANQDSEYVTFANGENDYIEIRTQPSISTAVATAPFNILPNNEYEISYDLRIPKDSASYVSGTYSASPEWWIYEVDQSKMDGYKVGNRSHNDSAYAYTGKRRDKFNVSYTYAYENGDIIATLVPSRTGFSFMDFKGSDFAFDNQNVVELFNEEWITVTIKFKGIESDTNKGAQLCALALGVTDAGTIKDTYFQVRNIQVKETGYGKTTPVYDEANGYQLSVEDFEYSGTQLSDVAKFYGGTYMTEISWAKNGSKIVTEDDNSFLKAYAHSNSMFLPLNKGALGKYRNLKVSFDWMFKNTGVAFEVASIQLVGYKYDVYTHTDDKDYPCVTDVNALAEVTPGELVLDQWNQSILNLTLNENTMAYENYAILIRYKATKPDTVEEFTAENASMYIDNLVVADGGALRAGDYDNNGEVDIEDIAKLAQHFAGWSSVRLYVDDTLADYNKDGKTNLFDLVRIAQDEAGWTPAE